MSCALDALRALLPAEWPTQENSDEAWWAKHGKGIKVEDWLAQAQLDMLFDRDPRITGSKRTISNLTVLEVASDNHKSARDTALLQRDDNPRPLLARLRAELANGFMGGEQYARYIRFRARDCFLALWYLANRQKPETRDHRNLREACRLWLGQCWYWLSSVALSGQPYSCGLRREFPERLDAILLRVLNGQPVDLGEREMGHSKGSIMNGGMPRATGEYLGTACQELGLLAGIQKQKPIERWPTVIEHPEGGIRHSFKRLQWRPGGGPILAAVEMHPDWQKPRLWVLADKHTQIPPAGKLGNDIYRFQPSSEWWDYRALEAA